MARPRYHAEVLEELEAAGFHVGPGQIGENVLTRGIDLLGLSRGTRLRLGSDALVEITGLRNPCSQLDAFQPGLMSALISRGPNGELIRKAGVMGIVLVGGDVRPGDFIGLEAPSALGGPPEPLGPV